MLAPDVSLLQYHLLSFFPLLDKELIFQTIAEPVIRNFMNGRTFYVSLLHFEGSSIRNIGAISPQENLSGGNKR
jgi:hypothetical protein